MTTYYFEYVCYLYRAKQNSKNAILVLFVWLILYMKYM